MQIISKHFKTAFPLAGLVGLVLRVGQQFDIFLFLDILIFLAGVLHSFLEMTRTK